MLLTAVLEAVAVGQIVVVKGGAVGVLVGTRGGVINLHEVYGVI